MRGLVHNSISGYFGRLACGQVCDAANAEHIEQSVVDYIAFLKEDH